MEEGLTVESVDIFKADIGFHEPFRIAIMEIPSAQNVFVRINAGGGLYGLGEASPTAGITGETQATNLAAAPDLARMLIGRDPLDIAERMGAIERFLVDNGTLRSAFDMALYDLAGKVAGLPLYALLGGGRRRFWTDNTIGLDTPERTVEKALRYKAEGFSAIKVKVGTTVEEDVRRVRSVREAIGPGLPIRIDANQGWDVPAAVAVLRAVEPFGVEYCEQPVPHWDLDGMRRVRERTAVPIMADESLFDHRDAVELARRGCCDYFNIKLAKCGGIRTALKIDAVAEGAGIACMLGSMSETRLGLSAAAHVVSARPNIRFADLDTWFLHKEDPVTGGITYDAGHITLPEAPGHGADLDPVFLARCEHVTVR